MRRYLFIIVFLITFVLPTPDVLAQDTAQIPQSQQEITLTFAPLVKKNAPAVVNIYTKRLVKSRVGVNPFFNDPFFNEFFGGGMQGMTRERMENTLGSGVIVRADGIVVTNSHVVKDAQEIAVVLSDGREFEAKTLLIDDKTDLAVLKADIKSEQLPTLEITNSDNLDVGDLVLAIGNPFGVGQTVTSGIVSAIARTGVGINDLNFFIQTDAAINPGNSGGALINMKGQLVGINSAIFSRNGGSLGIGFAIPSNMVKTVVMTAEAGGKKIKRPWSGISAQKMTSDIADSLGLKTTFGALVTGINPASPAGRAGLKSGDVILSVNNQMVQDPEAVQFRIATLAVGDMVDLGVLRKGVNVAVQFKAKSAPETPKRDEWKVTEVNPFQGTTVANISPALTEEYPSISTDDGVAIIIDNRISNVGDTVLAINGEKIESVDDLKSKLKIPARRWQVQLVRGGKVITLMVTG